MPELHKILGSLFSDIAQSVFTSDLYSREISRYYESDALLRHFPVPRTEVSELEIKLKFAISEIDLNLNQQAEREANSAPIFIEFCYNLSESFYEELQKILLNRWANLKSQKATDMTKSTLDQALEQTLRAAASGANPIYLRQDLLSYLQRSRGSLIEMDEEGVDAFQADTVRKEVLKILDKHVSSVVGETLPGQVEEILQEVDHTQAEKTRKEVREILKKHFRVEDILKEIRETIHLDSMINSLSEPLILARERAGDYKMDVEIAAGKLEELDKKKLSSVLVRTRVRNYKWSEVEHAGPRPWHSLNPE